MSKNSIKILVKSGMFLEMIYLFIKIQLEEEKMLIVKKQELSKLEYMILDTLVPHS